MAQEVITKPDLTRTTVRICASSELESCGTDGSDSCEELRVSGFERIEPDSVETNDEGAV